MKEQRSTGRIVAIGVTAGLLLAIAFVIVRLVTPDDAVQSIPAEPSPSAHPGVLGAPLGSPPGAPDGSQSAQLLPADGAAAAALRKLDEDTGGSWTLTGQTLQAGNPPPTIGFVELPEERPGDVAVRFLTAYGAIFGIEDVRTELRLELAADQGIVPVSLVKLRQVEGDLDVEGGAVTVMIGVSAVVSVTSTFVPGLLHAPRGPAVSTDQALAAARKDMGAAGKKADVAVQPRLGFYRDAAGHPLLGYRLVLGTTSYLVDARPGSAGAIVWKGATASP